MVDWKKLSKGLAHNGLLGVGLLALCFSYRWKIPEYTRLVSYGITVTGFYISAAYYLASEPKNDEDDEDEEIKRITEDQMLMPDLYPEVEDVETHIESDSDQVEWTEDLEAAARKWFKIPGETSDLSEDQRKKFRSLVIPFPLSISVRESEEELLEYLTGPSVNHQADYKLRVNASQGTMKRDKFKLPEPGNLTSELAKHEYLKNVGKMLRSAECYRMLKRRPSVSGSEDSSGEEDVTADIKYLDT